MPAACKPVADYFNATYVNGPLVGRTIRDGDPRNSHRRYGMYRADFLTLFLIPIITSSLALPLTDACHDRSPSVLLKLRQEQRHTEVQVLRLENGFRKKPRRRSVCQQHKCMTTIIGYKFQYFTITQCVRSLFKRVKSLVQ